MWRGPSEKNAAQDRNHGRNDEGHAPTLPCHQKASGQGGHGNAQVACQSIDANGQAGFLSFLDQHGNAHGVVDGVGVLADVGLDLGVGLCRG